MSEGRPAATGFEFNRPTIVALLYLVGILTGLPTLIAVVLAYIWRGESYESWEYAHYRYHIRSFWIGLLWGLIGFILVPLLGVGMLVLALIPIWLAVRSIVSLAAAQRREPVRNPQSWLW